MPMWNRLPVLLRALLAGIAVTGVPTIVWGLLVGANFVSHTRVPWASFVTAFLLVVYWKYLQGWGWPQSTAKSRRQSLRGHHLSGAVWLWSLLAGGFGLAASIVLFIVAHRLVRWPHPVRPDLSLFTPAVILPTLLVTAIVASMSEEAGFRGYMQGPLEHRYGPAAAITIASVVFGLAHLTHGAFLPAILFDIGWGALYGLLTYLSGSILPAVLLHACTDALHFILAWSLPPREPAPLIWQSVPDAVFLANCGLVVLLGSVSVWAFRQLAAITRSQRSASFATSE